MSKCVKSSEKLLNIFLRHEYISRMLPPSFESSRWKEKFVKFFSCAIWFIRLAQILHFVWFIKLISISSPFGFLSEGFSMVFVFFLPTHVHVHMHDSLPKLSWSGPIVTNVAISKKIMPKSLKKQETESLHSISFSAIFWYNLSKLLKFMPRINGELLQFCAIWHFIWIGWICLVSLGLILETIEGGKDIKIVPGIKINVPVIFFLLYYIGTQNK